MTHSSPLSKREREVLRLTAEGLTPEQIGTKLYLLTKTVHTYMMHMRRKLGATNNEQAVLIAAWYHAHLLAGCVVKHGTDKAVKAHETNGTPLCGACTDYLDAPKEILAPASPRVPYRRLTPPEQSLNHRKGDPVECGTIQAANRHIRAGERIGDLVCGCREAYQAWWREYRRERTGLKTAV